MNPSIQALVVDAATELNDGLTDRVPMERGAETPLFGGEGILDSLALVRLVLAVEDLVEERFGVAITLADERAVSQEVSPFRTIGTLAAFVETLLEEAGASRR